MGNSLLVSECEPQMGNGAWGATDRPMVWMMAFWTILSSLSLVRETTLVEELRLESPPISKSTLMRRCFSSVLNTSSTVGPAEGGEEARGRLRWEQGTFPPCANSEITLRQCDFNQRPVTPGNLTF